MNNQQSEIMVGKMEPAITICLKQLRVHYQDRDDLAQECRIFLLKLAPRWDETKSSWSHFAWLNIRFFLKDRLRTIRGIRRRCPMHMLQCQSGFPETACVEQPGKNLEQTDQFEFLIRPLRERLRSILRLYFVEDLTMLEIADRMQVCESRVSQLMKQAFQKLRENNAAQTEVKL